VGGDIPIDSETLLMTDFMNLKIKSVQSFGGAHRDRVYVCVYRSQCSYIYEYLRLYCIYKKIIKRGGVGILPRSKKMWCIIVKSSIFILTLALVRKNGRGKN
jgi:hypothetical protein